MVLIDHHTVPVIHEMNENKPTFDAHPLCSRDCAIYFVQF